jgi:excisionase family DNA binding protein
MSTKKLITVNEAAEVFRCSRWGIYCMVKDGRLAAVRLSNRRLLFTEEAIQEDIRNAEHQNAKTSVSVA